MDKDKQLLDVQVFQSLQVYLAMMHGLIYKAGKKMS
jgi:hypothetical protein